MIARSRQEVSSERRVDSIELDSTDIHLLLNNFIYPNGMSAGNAWISNVPKGADINMSNDKVSIKWKVDIHFAK